MLWWVLCLQVRDVVSSGSVFSVVRSTVALSCRARRARDRGGCRAAELSAADCVVVVWIRGLRSRCGLARFGSSVLVVEL